MSNSDVNKESFGRYLLVKGAIGVSCCKDDCDAAVVGEDVPTLLLGVSSPPFSPSQCGDDVLGRSCPCCSLSKMSAMMPAVDNVRRALGSSVVSGCSSGRVVVVGGRCQSRRQSC